MIEDSSVLHSHFTNFGMNYKSITVGFRSHIYLFIFKNSIPVKIKKQKKKEIVSAKQINSILLGAWVM